MHVRSRALRALGGLLAALLFSPVALRADTPVQGFGLTTLPYPGGLSTATLSSGDVVAFDGTSVALYDASGQLVRTLTTLSGFAFPSFLAVDPTETFVVAGESSNGDVFRVELAGGATPIANVPLNYDGVFEDAGHLLISAALDPSTNRVLRLDLATGATTPLVELMGASGPVAVDAAGDLVYGTISATFPAPPGSSDVLLFPRGLLDGSRVLGPGDATVLAAGFDGAGDFAVDGTNGDLYLAENDFSHGTSRVRRVVTSPQDSPVLVEGPPFSAIAALEVAAGPGPAVLRPFQPAAGGTLRYDVTDFATVSARRALSPQRATADVTGPGTAGPGPYDLEVAGGPANGFAFVFYGPSATYGPEYTFGLKRANVPLFLGLDPSTAVLPFLPFPLDASGAGRISFSNPTGAQGFLAAQALLFDGGTIVGTTTPAFL